MKDSENDLLASTLGRSLTADELSKYVGVSANTLRRYPEAFGGVKVGARVIFFEKKVIEVVNSSTSIDNSNRKNKNCNEFMLTTEDSYRSTVNAHGGKQKSKIDEVDATFEDRHNLLRDNTSGVKRGRARKKSE